ncbi:Homeodomain-like DNA binding domain-containing transcription factor [Phycomyces blakesleeanus]|uniref:Homeodomain-like DNA binding domain-containing transcription factor n=1 Tax=Phycomyces blakesleeanus TaxID=4837 RepID=A0ABR3B7U4_PHYBL
MNQSSPLRESSSEDAITKKRTRVTPGQLTVLEETFIATATPDNKMRKQLAHQLQMPERSIQIWFQNRRAKVKMLQKRDLLREEQEATRARMYAKASSYKSSWYPSLGYNRPQVKMPIQRAWSTDNQPLPPSIPNFYPFLVDDISTPSMAPFDTIQPNISVNSPSHLITVNTVTVGSWHRMKIDREDLLCQCDFRDRTLTWFIRDSVYNFKMVLPFDIISVMRLSILEDSILATIDIDLIEPPMFYMENGGTDMTNGGFNWIQCSDFTEGIQATCILRHTLQGLAVDLRREMLAMAGADEQLCQIMRFPTQQDPQMSQFDQMLAQNWRHQSVPVHGFQPL